MEKLKPEDVIFSLEPGDSAPNLRRPHWTWDKAPPATALVAYVMGQDGQRLPASCARLFLRHLLSPGGQSFKAYGVGGVFTAEPWRGRGLASMVLRRADGFARERASYLALYAPYGTGLYLRSGYVAVAQANDTEHLWVRSTDPGLLPMIGHWKVVCPEGHF